MSAEPLPIDEGRMTLMEHLIELRRRVIICAVAIVACAVVGWFMYPWISDFLLRPYQDISSASFTEGRLQGISPLEGFSVRIKITTYVGIALAMPVILWQIWKFVSPGLYKHERRYAFPFVASALALFVMGAAIAYWTLPKALGWLSSVGGANIVAAYSAEKYFQLIAYMMLAFGIGFEFPIVLILLQLIGVVSTDTLRKYRRHAIVGIFVIVAVATPSNDPISLFALSFPMCVFYEVSILIGRFINRRRAKAHASAAS